MRWTYIDGSPPTLEADSQLYCLNHPRKKVKLDILTAKLLQFPMTYDNEKKMSNAVDLWLRCPYCGAMELWGVAVSNEQWEGIRNGKGIN